GAQENYEATIATGWRLLLWRMGLILILPVAAIAWLGFVAMIAATLCYFALASVVLFASPKKWRQSERFIETLLGHDWFTGQNAGHPSPQWLESVLSIAARMVSFPLAAAFYCLASVTLFSETRRRLLPFLVSRPILAGSGRVAEDGTFFLAD